MRWKRIVSLVLALSFVIGTVSGLPPLKTQAAQQHPKVSKWNKAYNWGTKDEFVDMVKSKYRSRYKTIFHKNGSSVFKGKNGFKVDLKEKIDFPDGTGDQTYRYWWFVTLDKYHTEHTHAAGTTKKTIAYPKHEVPQNTLWATTYLRAKEEKSKTWDSASAKGGYFFECIELGGSKDKFKEDLGRTVGGMGVSMYVIDMKQWMSDKKTKGYTKWKNKYIAKNNHTIVHMYLNAVVKTYGTAGAENTYRYANLQSYNEWRKYTQSFPMYNYPNEYYQHYNVPVEFDFGTIEDYKINVVVESRLAQDSNKYSKTYTNQDFSWSKNIGVIERKNKANGGVYFELETAEGKKNKNDDDGQFFANSGFKIDKSLIKALTKNGDLVLRGVRLERYAVDKTKGDKPMQQNIIPKSFTKKQTEKLKDKYFDYGDVAHVYLTGETSELRKMFASPNSVKTTNHSVKNANLAKGAVDKNSFATKVQKVNVADKGKFYTLSGKYNANNSKSPYTITAKGDGSKDAKKNYKWVNGDLGSAITYNQFLDYVCSINFQVNPYEEYGTGKDAVYRKYENHLVFIFERASEPKVSLDVERVSFNSKTGKYTRDGLEHLDVDNIHCKEGENPITGPVTLNVGATAKETLTGNRAQKI